MTLGCCFFWRLQCGAAGMPVPADVGCQPGGRTCSGVGPGGAWGSGGALPPGWGYGLGLGGLGPGCGAAVSMVGACAWAGSGGGGLRCIGASAGGGGPIEAG